MNRYINQRFIELDGARGAFGTTDDIVGKKGGVEEEGKGVMDEGDLLVEGVFRGVDDGIDMLLTTPGIDGGSELGVEAGEFVAMVDHLLEGDALGMTEEKEVEGLGERGELYLKRAKIGEQDAIVRGNDKAAELLLLNEFLSDGAQTDATAAKLKQTCVYLVEELTCFIVEFLLVRVIGREIEVGVFGQMEVRLLPDRHIAGASSFLIRPVFVKVLDLSQRMQKSIWRETGKEGADGGIMF